MFEVQHEANLVTNAAAREREVYNYQVNIDNYMIALKALPSGDPPAALADMIGVPARDLPNSVADADVLTISEFQFRDQLVKLLRSERIEQAKAKSMLDVLKQQIGAEYADKVRAHIAANPA